MVSGGGNVSTAVLLCGVSSRALTLAFRSPQGVMFFYPMTQRRQLALPIFQITFQPIRAWGGTESPALVCKAFRCAHVCWGRENWVLFSTWLLLAVASCLLICPKCISSQQLEGPLTGEGRADSWAPRLQEWWQGSGNSSRSGQEALLPGRRVPFKSPKEALKSQAWEVKTRGLEFGSPLLSIHSVVRAEKQRGERGDTCDLSGM
ncbi:unnamed protein product [Rangifer tarandus platyrhynchus]|uniref:Uncharacterized protein n=1 Tax=Rangifer tarandus platyrhynchus TaxID=3082113 RepID=A0AC59Z198_RANTA